MRWIIPTKTMSLVGSTQNQVPAAPSQKKVPLPSGRSASRRIEDDGAVVAVAEAGAHDVRADAEFAGEQFGGTGWRSCSLTVEGARMRLPSSSPPLREHLREAVVVFGGGDHAAAAGRHGGLSGCSLSGTLPAGGLGDELRFVGVARVVAWRSGRACLAGTKKPASRHAEGLEDVVAHEVGQRLAGELFDDVALDIHGHAVDPSFAGLIEQRNLGELVDHLLEVLATA